MFRWSRTEALVATSIITSFFLVWPVGEYLIGDDWVYTKSLEKLHETGVVRILHCAPMTLVGHLWWALGFTKVFGFGMTVTRISTAVLALIECVAFIALLRRFRLRESALLMAALGLLFGPLHFVQSFMYSTDIPTNAWSVLALLFYVRGLSARDGSVGWQLLVASCFAGMALSVRQSAILVVLAVLLYRLLFERKSLRNPSMWLYSFGPAAVAMAALNVWYFWFHGPTEAYVAATETIGLHLRQMTFEAAIRGAYIPLAYVALFALPVLVALPWNAYQPRRGARMLAGGIASALIALAFIVVSSHNGAFPYLRNKLTPFGYLHPNELLVGARDVLWPSGLGYIIGGVLCLGAIGCALLLIRGLPPADRDDDGDGDGEHARRVGARLLATLLALQLLYAVLTVGIIFDRHLIMAAPVTIALFVTLGEARAKMRWLPFAVLTSALALYGIAGSHELHAFSRAGFSAGQELIHEGTDPQLIDAGYAFTGWHMYERSRSELASGHRPLTRDGDAWYLQIYAPRVLSKYVVSLSESMDERRWRDAVLPWAAPYVFRAKLDRHVVIDEQSYRTFWPSGPKKVYVLRDALLPDSYEVAGPY